MTVSSLSKVLLPHTTGDLPNFVEPEPLPDDHRISDTALPADRFRRLARVGESPPRTQSAAANTGRRAIRSTSSDAIRHAAPLTMNALK